jgi:hypothetical protein
MTHGLATPIASRRVVSAGTLTGDRVRNPAGEDLGNIEEIMVDLESGEVAYAVLSFGGFLGLGDKLFAVPFEAMSFDENNEFILDVDKATLKNAPGFDKDNWPNFADPAFYDLVHAHYDVQPYMERPDAPSAVPLVETSATAESVTEANEAEASRERVSQPDMPNELRWRSVDVTDFQGRDKDADLRTSDPSRSYGVVDTTTRK